MALPGLWAIPRRPLEPLLGGFSLYLLGHVVVWRRAAGRWRLPLAGLALAVLALWPVGAAVPPLLALGIGVSVLGALLAWERTRAREASRHVSA
jgi:hypothetical protein